MARPNIEEIAKAREHCRDAVENDLWPDPGQVDVLLAATESPTDDEIMQVFSNASGPVEAAIISTIRHFLGLVKP